MLFFEHTAASAGHRQSVTQSASHAPGVHPAAVAPVELGHLQPEEAREEILVLKGNVETSSKHESN